MGLLVGIAFAFWVLYSFGKGLANCDDGADLIAYLAGIAFVLWAVSAVFG